MVNLTLSTLTFPSKVCSSQPSTRLKQLYRSYKKCACCFSVPDMLSDYGPSNIVTFCFANRTFLNLCRLPCGHSICHVDIVQILLQETAIPKKAVKCPACRVNINARPGINFALKDIIHDWVLERDTNFNFAEWKSADANNIICSFFSPQSGEVLHIPD